MKLNQLLGCVFYYVATRSELLESYGPNAKTLSLWIKKLLAAPYSKQTHALSPKCLQGLIEVKNKKASEQTHQNVESREQREV